MIDRILRARNQKPLGCILTLPGRGGSGRQLANIYRQYAELKKTLIIGVTPKQHAWYPMPNGVNDQYAAVEGLKIAVGKIKKTLKTIRRRFGIGREETVLTGFSAGAVVALETAIRSTVPFAAVVSHSGAVLEPDSIPPCKHPDMPILLIHCKDDTCFYWDERYLPTKEALLRQGYKVACIEHNRGEHVLFPEDIAMTGLFLAPLLNYPPSWRLIGAEE